VETRVPFLDPALMALAARIPDRWRQHGRQGKWILKQALAGVLPDDVIHRPKTGFGVPLRSWLRGALAPMLHDLLSREAIARRGLFDANVIGAMIADNAVGRADYSYSLFGAMCVELWCRQFLVPGGSEAPR
jgi:asparagine synthase (glutamine-hydrolysing)